MDDFIEVSAVTSEHTGICRNNLWRTANAILEQNKIPFLHVAAANISNII
jgi:hypothetical protein